MARAKWSLCLRTLAGRQGGRAPQLEADLVVALARGAVRHGVRAHRGRDLDLLLGDQRPRDRRAQQVHALVQRVRPAARMRMLRNSLLAEQ